MDIIEHLQNIDWAFTATVALFALLTPKISEYTRVNRLIVGMSCVFLGLSELHIALNMEWTWLISVSNSGLSLIFAYLFWPKSKTHLLCDEIGRFISFLCVSMALFHIGDMLYNYSVLAYASVVICFLMLLLMAASWGVIDGNSNRINSWYRATSAWFGSHFRSHGRG